MSTFKKESGAQGRKRRVAEAAQSQKDSSHFRSFFNVVPSKKVAKNDEGHELEDEALADKQKETTQASQTCTDDDNRSDSHELTTHPDHDSEHNSD